MTKTSHDLNEIRFLIRQAIRDVIGDLTAGPGIRLGATPYEQRIPEPQGFSISVQGSERSISILERALSAGNVTLEIAIGSPTGPKIRVQASECSFRGPTGHALMATEPS